MWVLVGDREGSLPPKELLTQTGFLSVHQTCHLVTLMLTARVLRSGKPQWLANMLVELPECRNRKRLLKQDRCQLNARAESLGLKCQEAWNNIPATVKERDQSKTKKTLKQWVRANAIKPEVTTIRCQRTNFRQCCPLRISSVTGQSPATEIVRNFLLPS